MCNHLDTIPVCDRQTDGQTSCHDTVRAMHIRCAVKTSHKNATYLTYLCCMVFSDNKVGDDWPLTTTQLTILKSNYSHLVQFLDIDTDMLRRLSQCGCITQEQMNWLSRKHLEKRNKAMLDILKRRSQRSLQQFIACLNRTTRNSRALQILEHAEGQISPHFTLF